MRRYLYFWTMIILVLVLTTICAFLRADHGHGANEEGIRVVRGAVPTTRLPPASVPMQAVEFRQRETRRMELAENVSRSIETGYGVVKRANVSCSGEVCVLDATLDDISSEDEARSLDTLLDSSMGPILARNGFSPQGNVVIDVMGGIYTGFHVEMRQQ